MLAQVYIFLFFFTWLRVLVQRVNVIVNQIATIYSLNLHTTRYQFHHL